MNAWEIKYTEKAQEDLDSFDTSAKRQIVKALDKVSRNPLPRAEGGYGVELRANLSDCLKIKLKKAGIRIIYQIHREKDQMKIIIIGMRADSEVYKEAVKRLGR